jgi:hypothetical protein
MQVKAIYADALSDPAPAIQIAGMEAAVGYIQAIITIITTTTTTIIMIIMITITK